MSVAESPFAVPVPTRLPESKSSPPPALDIIDIRSDVVDFDLKADIVSLLDPATGPRKLPTLLLYDQRGLQLFEDITYLDEYYLTNDEISILRRFAAQIVSDVPAGSMVVELGSGNLRKVCFLLQAFEDQGKAIDYYALDLSKEELERTLADVPDFQHVRCHGLWGTYDNGKEWLKQPHIAARPKCILHLGSSIGNFPRDEGAAFLKGFADLLQPLDSLVLGLDSCMRPDRVYHAYNDKEGTTHRFIINGLQHANAIYGQEVFQIPDWKVIGEFVYDDDGGRHQAFVAPNKDVTVLDVNVKAGERIRIEQSFKYSRSGADKLFKVSGLTEVEHWQDISQEYGIHLLKKDMALFSLNPAVYAPSPLPTMVHWQALWNVWDRVTLQMLPSEDLAEKPIRLRNACIFYLGHIPTFLDIQLCKTTQSRPTQPAYFQTIFERGVDPDVDNPEKCHDHSVIPDEWPQKQEILTYQQHVRDRLRDLYANPLKISRGVARAIWVGFEHEAMHLETLLYMMLQSDKTLPPPDTIKPNFEEMARKAMAARVENQWFDVPARDVVLGMDDPESSTDPDCDFGWDCEKPARKVQVHAFQAKGRAITNEEYANYLCSVGLDRLPASWCDKSGTDASVSLNGVVNGNGNADANGALDHFYEDKYVRTVYGLVPLRQALDWPIFASYDELAGCAKWMGGRIPTLEEAKSIYDFVEWQRKSKQAPGKLSTKFPAVNGHLVNDGVEETPPSEAGDTVENGASLFIDLANANVGFTNWHPVPVTANGNRLAGQSDLGGVWEWTSSPLRRHEGFEPMSLYPAYTADFFDDKHNVVLGGSWATHPRIAGRKSFVNWYQRNYPYAWIGARLVRDV